MGVARPQGRTQLSVRDVAGQQPATQGLPCPPGDFLGEDGYTWDKTGGKDTAARKGKAVRESVTIAESLRGPRPRRESSVSPRAGWRGARGDTVVLWGH